MTPDPASPCRRRYRVFGRVQGVGFRAWTVEQARALDVRGLVRNCSDGSVEVEAEGRAEALDALTALLARGPAYARVAHIERLSCTERPLPSRFTVDW